MKRTLSAILLCLFVHPAFAADKWQSIRFKNFQLVGNASESDMRRVGRYLEEFRSAFALMFPRVEQGSTTPTNVVVFKNDESFAPYRLANQANQAKQAKAAKVVGYFQPADDVNYIAVPESMDAPSAIFHDYIQFLMHEMADGLPLWAKEGLAQCYSTFEMTKQNEFTLGRAHEDHIVTLKDKAFLPLKTLFGLDYTAP